MKKSSLPAPTAAEKALGIRRYLLTEDLTNDNYKCLKALRDDSRISRAWSVEGNIRFVRSNDPGNSIMRVNSPYEHISTLLG